MANSVPKDEKSPAERPEPVAKAMVKLVTNEAELFHTPEGEPFVSVPVGSRREIFDLRQREFSEWVSKRFFEVTGNIASQSPLHEAVQTIQGISKFVASEQKVHVRLAEYDGCIFLDLADEARRVARISSEGWEIVPTCPVKFRRPPGMQALPLPVRGGTFMNLRQFLNIGEEDQWILIVSWLVAALRPSGPYPILVLQGNHGTSKSTVTRLLKSLIDPSKSPLRSEPRDVRDLMISCTNARCLAFDNLSDVPEWLSDALCRLSTGGGFATRQLYADINEVLIEATRPVILNGIDIGINRGDLLDRTLTISLPSISPEGRLTEDRYWSEFEAVKPRVLDALLNAVACGLRRLSEVRLSRCPRMADFATWVTACEPALGWSEGTFLATYERSLQDLNELALEGSLLVPVVREFVVHSPSWTGTATELLHTLRENAQHFEHMERAWPRTAAALSGILRRLAPSLKSAGIVVQFCKTAGTNSRRFIKIDSRPQS